MTNIKRRQFLKTSLMTGAGVVGNLFFPHLILAATTYIIFNSDSEKTLLARMLYGEGGTCTAEEKIEIGKTPFNRVNDGKLYNGEGCLKKVLLHPKQYNCFDLTEKNKENLERILNPKGTEWEICNLISKKLLNEELEEYNKGQTHYYMKYLIPLLKAGKLKVDPSKLEPIQSPEYFAHQFYKELS